MSDAESSVSAPVPDGTNADSDDGEGDAGEPSWLVAALLIALSGLAIAGIVGLALAIVAEFDALLVALIGVPMWAGVVFLGWPLVEQARARPALRHATAATLCMLVFLLGWLAWNVPRTAQHVLIERDPGSYTNTARWVARDGSLEVDVSKPPFAHQNGLVFGSAAIYLLPEEQVLQFQFSHFAPIVLAEMHGIGGDRLMFRGTVLVSALALLTLFTLALRVLRRPWLALAATIGLGVCLPQVYFSRDSFSELPMQALLLGGLWLLALARRTPRVGPGVVAGVALGAMAATRIDAPLLLLAPIAVIGVEWLGTGRGDRRVARLAGAFALGAAVPIAVGAIDLAARSGYYDTDLGPKYRATWAVVLLAVIGVAIVISLRHMLPGLRRWLADRRDALGTAAGVALAALLVFLWGPRRLISRPAKHSTNDTMRAIELREGIRPASGKRTYAEQSVEWIRWNIGVIALVLGIIGAAILASELVRRRRRDALGLFVAFCTGGVLYLWQPTIFPDQPWAMRRFLPVLLPAMFVFGALTIGWLMQWIGRRSTPRVSGIAGAVLAAGLVVPAAVGTWPVREMRSQAGYVNPVLWTCDEVGPHGAIIVLPSQTQLVHRTLPQALRSWCGVPVAVAQGQLTPERTAELKKATRAAGRKLYLVAGEAEPLQLAGAHKIRPSNTAVDPYNLSSRLAGLPNELHTRTFTIALGNA